MSVKGSFGADGGKEATPRAGTFQSAWTGV